MSKTVRLADYLYEQVEELALQERRSLANMVKVLLEQALKMDDQPITKKFPVTGGEAQVSISPRIERAQDPHFKPDPK